ncbi:hypothetical protein Dda_2738 [Drechslerella dactyloides]|uniref:Uncharacterized protein n=1 Tax=Drechslerella dactyloides TaxID=74499 RepID=A0AAD6NKK4_DREDA|nr:hypothetical protein Dda_2738 [Drechslerella dactyloides]
MAYTGAAAPVFDSYQPSEISSDMDILEHFELPEEYSAVTEAPLIAPSKYSLAIRRDDAPPAVQSFIRSLRSHSFPEIFEGFQSLYRNGLTHHLASGDFSNIIRAAKPTNIFPISWMARRIKHGMMADSNPYDEVYQKFWAKMNFVLETMTQHDHGLSVLDYTNLMSKAVWSRSPKLQVSLWERMVVRGIRPNTWTYNARLAMVAGIRPQNNLNKFPLVNKKDHTDYWRSQEQNALTESMALYADLLKNGLFPNTMTVELLVLAHSTVGDIAGISKLVRNVYGIAIGEENGDLKRAITHGSPIYPTSKTLKIIALAYCRNGQFTAALQAVELISTTYKIPIKDDTWDLLIVYSYAFSRPKYNLLPTGTTARLVEMRKDNANGRPPSLQARDVLIRSLARSTDPDELELAEQEIRAAVRYYRTHVQQKYMVMRDRWLNNNGERRGLWRRELAMNEKLYQLCMWKDAMGYWLYALLRSHWELTTAEKTSQMEFENRQINLMEEFGAYWHRHRPMFGPPEKEGPVTAVPGMVSYRSRYPASMVGLKGFPAM